jgi:acetoacetyl-CoA synthetase
MTKILWKPEARAFSDSHMAKFMEYVACRTGHPFSNYFELYRWSLNEAESFWSMLWDFCKIRGQKNIPSLKNADDLEHSIWFENSTLNFAENLLTRNDEHPALIAISESGEQKRMSYAELNTEVAILQHYFSDLGLKPGDRVAACLPNCAETIVAMLATVSLGATWSSCSPDFGVSGLLDRFSQIDPKILFITDFHAYHGKIFSHMDQIADLKNHLSSLEKIIIVPFNDDYINIPDIECYPEIMAKRKTTISKLIFPGFFFNHPLYILYSSGTTGKPKCMVHGAGGTLLQHSKELMLHVDLHPEDKIFFYTTCGWMMWNWFVSSLKVGATLVLYDGSPFYPNPTRFFDLIDELGISILGVGAKYIETCAKKQLIPRKSHSLLSLKTILTTGSPLLPESFDYIHEKIKSTARISSISGGSDIVSCFALGNPILPVYRGQIQCLGLGMAVDIFDDTGISVKEKTGELVCTKTFPCKPIYFWNDPKGELYHKAYFAKYPNVWAHGDYAQLTAEGGLIIYGRSDATLNPGGIRIGTAEIYNQVEKIEAIVDCLAVAQEWEGDERIILFVVLKENEKVDEALKQEIKWVIRTNTSPHHVPAVIIAVPDLPRTLNGKIAELAVKNIIHHQAVKNRDALLNPESLEYFKDLVELDGIS